MIDVMKHHARLLCDFHGGDFGVRDFRKHVSWYLTGYPIGGERRKMLAMTSTLHELDERLDELDRSLDLPKESYRLARGHTNGPRPVDLPHRWFETANDVDTVIEDDGTVSGG